MAILERVKDLVKANINDLIDKAEDPEKMLKQIIIDMEQEIQVTIQGLVQVMASEKQMLRQQQSAAKQSTEWEAKAKLALSNGNQELAKQALLNKLKNDDKAKQYEEMQLSLSTQVQTMRSQVEELKAKVDQARSKQAILAARAQLANTQKQFAKTMNGTDGKSAISKMEKMETKVEQKETEAAAWSDLSGDASVNISFEKMEQDNAVTAELIKLMAKMEQKN